jgi:CRISPR-associated endoribonuclease Cas6
MTQRSLKKDQAGEPNLTWPSSTELVGLVFEVVPQKTATLFPDYTKTLHAWFLDQVRSHDPQSGKG